MIGRIYLDVFQDQHQSRDWYHHGSLYISSSYNFLIVWSIFLFIFYRFIITMLMMMEVSVTLPPNVWWSIKKRWNYPLEDISLCFIFFFLLVGSSFAFAQVVATQFAMFLLDFINVLIFAPLFRKFTAEEVVPTTGLLFQKKLVIFFVNLFILNLIKIGVVSTLFFNIFVSYIVMFVWMGEFWFLHS